MNEHFLLYTQCKAAAQLNLNQYLGVSHLSGIPGSFLLFYSLKLTSQIICISIPVRISKKCIRIKMTMESHVLSDSFQC